MTTAQPSIFARDDTFFGVCQAIGEDTGINANVLRVALGVSVLVYPAAVLATYAFLGVVVFATRWFFPVRARSTATEVPAAPAQNEAHNDAQAEQLPLAA